MSGTTRSAASATSTRRRATRSRASAERSIVGHAVGWERRPSCQRLDLGDGQVEDVVRPVQQPARDEPLPEREERPPEEAIAARVGGADRLPVDAERARTPPEEPNQRTARRGHPCLGLRERRPRGAGPTLGVGQEHADDVVRVLAPRRHAEVVSAGREMAEPGQEAGQVGTERGQVVALGDCGGTTGGKVVPRGFRQALDRATERRQVDVRIPREPVSAVRRRVGGVRVDARGRQLALESAAVARASGAAPRCSRRPPGG